MKFEDKQYLRLGTRTEHPPDFTVHRGLQFRGRLHRKNIQGPSFRLPWVDGSFRMVAGSLWRRSGLLFALLNRNYTILFQAWHNKSNPPPLFLEGELLLLKH